MVALFPVLDGKLPLERALLIAPVAGEGADLICDYDLAQPGCRRASRPLRLEGGDSGEFLDAHGTFQAEFREYGDMQAEPASRHDYVRNLALVPDVPSDMLLGSEGNRDWNLLHDDCATRVPEARVSVKDQITHADHLLLPRCGHRPPLDGTTQHESCIRGAIPRPCSIGTGADAAFTT